MTPGAPPPAEPTTLREMYDPAFEVVTSSKWRKQLLDRCAHRRSTATDVAELVIELEEDELANMLAFPRKEGNDLYISNSGGVWVQVIGGDAHEIVHAIGQLTDRMDRIVISACVKLIRRLRAAASGTWPIIDAGPEAISDEMRAAEDHLRDLTQLFEKLRTPAFAAGVVKRIVTARVMDTRAAGIVPSSLDTADRCFAFSDGVFCLVSGKLLGVADARRKYQTLNVGYSYEEVAEGSLDADTSSAYDLFMTRIFSSAPESRRYLIDLLASSLLNENRQVIVFHYNVSGSNGKTTLFELIRRTLGALFIKCASTLLNPATITSPSAPNEELVSIRGRRIVMVSEPSSQLKLSASAIKEITGGDEQSTRGMHMQKQTFVFTGTLHVLCNKIPEIDDMDGGVARRLRCIPYGSEFTSDPSRVAEDRHLYAMDATVSGNFEAWRPYLLREIMVAAERRIEARQSGDLSALDCPPVVVRRATDDLVERENTVGAFVKRCLDRTECDRDHASLKDAYDRFREYCGAEQVVPMKKKFFKSALTAVIGPIVEKSNGEANFWKGWLVCNAQPDAVETSPRAEMKGWTG
jgi:P4 family phage/plasmid primase-like protien